MHRTVRTPLSVMNTTAQVTLKSTAATKPNTAMRLR
jgi:hypothetical protein